MTSSRISNQNSPDSTHSFPKWRIWGCIFWMRHYYWVCRGTDLKSRVLELETRPNMGVMSFQKWAQTQGCIQSRPAGKNGLWRAWWWVIGDVEEFCSRAGRSGHGGYMPGPVLSDEGRDEVDKYRIWLCSNQECTLWGRNSWVWISVLSLNSCMILGKWKILQASLSSSMDWEE